ncbi:MAG: SIS domain-containing protein [Bacteroidota bacterium]|jgi:arabinose-5-phosphate isomerase
MNARPLPQDVVDALQLQRNALDLLEKEINEEFDRAVDALMNAGGIVATGVGKSGFVARKFAASLASLGLQASFMHSADALHGDLGVVRQGTSVVMFSKSGETAELVSLLDALKSEGVTLISVTSRRETTLSNRAHIRLVAPIDREYDRMNILPTASTTTSLIVADLLVMSIAHRRPESMDVLARTHPHGSIGSLLGQRVQDHMHSGASLPSIVSDAKLDSAVHELDRHALGIVCVVRDGLLLRGILTDGDVRRLVERGVDFASVTVDSVMTAAPTTVPSSASLHEALMLMESPHRAIGVLPVVNGSELVGVIRLHDVVRAQMAG